MHLYILILLCVFCFVLYLRGSVVNFKLKKNLFLFEFFNKAFENIFLEFHGVVLDVLLCLTVCMYTCVASLLLATREGYMQRFVEMKSIVCKLFADALA